MYLIGELKDEEMAREIQRELHDLGVIATIDYDSVREIFSLKLSSEDRLLEARDLYRVKLGFHKPVEIEEEWIKIKTIPRGQMTYSLILICTVIYLLSLSNLGDALYNSLFVSRVESDFLAEIKRGQFWRLVTPALLHMSFLHLLFNLSLFSDLGNLIENHFGRTFYLWFFILSAAVSNLLQYFVNGPMFGGMSGVLYSMFGFIWIYKKLNSDFDFSLPKRDVWMMILWYFFCLTGILGPIANTAHGMGLVVGMIVAILMEFELSKERLKFFSLAIFFFIFTILVEGYKLNGRFFVLINN
jgi:GlpG protein